MALFAVPFASMVAGEAWLYFEVWLSGVVPVVPWTRLWFWVPVLVLALGTPVYWIDFVRLLAAVEADFLDRYSLSGDRSSVLG